MALTPEEQEVYVSIWQKAVDTQMHFNEMSVKARQFGLTFVAAALGLGIVMLSRGQEFALSLPYFGGFEFHATVLLVLASAFALYAVRQLDLKVYHRMLRGSVTFGEDFEENYVKKIFDLEKGMTQAISHYSRFDDAKVEKGKPKYHYMGSQEGNAEEKIRRFYNFSIGALLAAAIGLFLLTAHFGEGESPRRSPTQPAPSSAVPGAQNAN
jgi:hypothetical protein